MSIGVLARFQISSLSVDIHRPVFKAIRHTRPGVYTQCWAWERLLHKRKRTSERVLYLGSMLTSRLVHLHPVSAVPLTYFECLISPFLLAVIAGIMVIRHIGKACWHYHSTTMKAGEKHKYRGAAESQRDLIRIMGIPCCWYS
mgnify:CR=1 FL=1|jgi:hypothetical protein